MIFKPRILQNPTFLTELKTVIEKIKTECGVEYYLEWYYSYYGVELQVTRGKLFRDCSEEERKIISEFLGSEVRETSDFICFGRGKTFYEAFTNMVLSITKSEQPCHNTCTLQELKEIKEMWENRTELPENII